MKKHYKIGLLKETKTPPDRRVAIPPIQAKELMLKYQNLQIVVQPSDLRCYTDFEYVAAGVPLQSNLGDCDLLLGVKEVNTETLLQDKTYLFFAHVAKMQPHNRNLLQSLIEKRITLLDLEYLTNPKGERLVAFGHWAGIIGAYNGLIAYGRRTGSFSLRRAKDCHDYFDLVEGLKSIKLDPIRILITGGGRAADGAMEIFKELGVEEVEAKAFLTRNYNKPVICRLHSRNYVQRKDGRPFERQYWFDHPSDHKSVFLPYTKVTDLLVACHYWDFRAPHFFRKEDMTTENFSIKVIADVSCDVPGPIPSTLRATTIAEPFYDYSIEHGIEVKPFTSDKHVSMMTIDNLSGELPRDASEFFGKILIDNVIPCFLGDDQEGVVKRATIVKEGKLTERFAYLKDYLDGKE